MIRLRYYDSILQGLPQKHIGDDSIFYMKFLRLGGKASAGTHRNLRANM